MKRHLSRLAVLLGCLLLLTSAVFADDIQNTDDDKADIDGSYEFTNETERYGYRSYLYYNNCDYDNYVGARLYDVTIPDEGKLIAEISSSEIRHMTIDIYSFELKKRIVEKEYDVPEGGTIVLESMALPKGKNTVTFAYTWKPNYIIPYDEDEGKKYFDHYISWEQESYIRSYSVTLSKKSASLNISDNLYLDATVGPSNAYYKDVTWVSLNASVATVDSYGHVTAVAPGTATIKAVTKDGTSASCTVTVLKKANPLKVAGKTVTVKYSKLKKKAQTLVVTKVINFKNKISDSKTYTLVSAKKGTKSYKKYFTINKTTGKVKIKKGLKKGTYKVTVTVQGAGNKTYKASAKKKVTFTIKVK